MKISDLEIAARMIERRDLILWNAEDFSQKLSVFALLEALGCIIIRESYAVCGRKNF
jgi:hypothetical protein